MEGDVLLAISTSGNSKNVLMAAKDARARGIYVAGLMGGDGGKLADLADTALVVNSKVTARVQEAHILAGHILCQLVDHVLFQNH